MLFQMAPRSQFSTDDWWGKLGDLGKVCWHFAKEKGIEYSLENCP